MSLNSYRFSLEWARIEPGPGRFSIAMLDHYKAMIQGCRDRGLTPVVTFNHFTTPIWFAARAGWGNWQAPELFARFCDRAARHLADEIGYATTLNEPNLAGKLQPNAVFRGGRPVKSGSRGAVAPKRLLALDPSLAWNDRTSAYGAGQLY